MKVSFPCLVALACGVLTATLGAAPRTSTSYKIAADVQDSAGGRSSSANYTNDASMGGFGGESEALPAAEVARHGFMGQLYEAQSLVVSAAPGSVVEKQQTQLSGVVTMTDDTTVNLAGSELQWSLESGPITGIDSTGKATAGEVFVNAPAVIRGFWDGVQGEVALTVLNANVTPPGDPMPEPVFTGQVFSSAHLGIHQGILRDGSGNVVGAITGLNLGSTRAFSGKVILNGVTYSLSGSFLVDGSFTGQILRKGKTPLNVTLQLGATHGGGLTIQGSVSGDGTTGTGLIAHAPYGKTSPAPAALVKRYTFLIPATRTGDSSLPEGDGYGSAVVSPLGTISATGKTGDGVVFSANGYLTADRQWHLFQLLYSSKGQMAGVLTFRDVPNVSDLDGQLRWAKNPNAADKSYPLGFQLEPGLVGSLYAPPAAGQRAIASLADQHYNARLTLGGTVLADSGFSKVLSWLPTNVLTYYGLETLSASTTAATGILTGSYYDPVLKLKVPFAGAVLQKQKLAGGNFLTSYRSGYLLVEPGTQFPYPGGESAGALARVMLPGSLAPAPVLSPAMFSAAAAGSFGGILENGPAISGGLESVVLSKTGALSGSVVIEGRRYAFKGTFGSNGQASVVILRKGMTDINGTLSLALANGTADGFQLTGTFTADGATHDIDAQRYPAFTKTAPAPQMGAYTLAMRAPDAIDTQAEPGGDGYASLAVAYTGAATGSLTLADGTVTTFAGRVSRKGEWSFHRSLYTSGYLAGKLTFRPVAGISDLDGQWRWVKPNAVPKTPTYPGGFAVTRGVVGSLYTPPAAGTRAFAGLSNGFYNSWLRFSGPDMSTLAALSLTAVDRAVTWNTANKILYYGPDKATITFAPATGLITGTYADKDRGVNLPFGGALLQKQGLVTGRYTAIGRSGLMTMSAR